MSKVMHCDRISAITSKKVAGQSRNTPSRPSVPLLNDLPSSFIFEQKREGLRQLYKPTQRETHLVTEQIRKVWEVFCEQILSSLHPPINGIFLYDSRECQGDYNIADGICVWSEDSSAFYIGLASDIVQSSEAEILSILIHELAHALAYDFQGGGHNPHYEAYLDMMYMQYNSEYGTELQNDYVTFNDAQ